METDLTNEKALLTPAMINEREEDIDIKKKELKRLQEGYFGPTGDLFQMRKQFVKPVQDQVFNAIQTIAETKKYDFIFDKSSDLIMLYSNSNFDVSELVLNSIVKDRKRQTLEDNKNARGVQTKAVEAVNLPDSAEDEAITPDLLDTEKPEGEVKSPEQIKAEEKAAKQAELKARIKEQQEAREILRDSLKRVSEERRAAKLKEIEDKNKKREELLKEINN
ncbi:MAG: OmpH family outer membrane protein [Flavobacteriaceae bacterium]|nr:OmpH family outer membrane protein [Flavobacteriaceae bacterium]